MKGFQFLCYYMSCGKSFNNKYNLKRHINTVHLQIKEFICEVCGKELMSKVAHKEHLYSHLKVKPIKCPYPGCALEFSRSSMLCSHKKVHRTGSLYNRTAKTYEKRKESEILPAINESRQERQISTKVPLHHLLIS